MGNKFRFTKAALEAIEAPSRGRLYVYDLGCSGLALCVTANNARTFYRCGRIGGEFKRLPLGKYERMTIEQARKAATKVNAEIADGGNPADSTTKIGGLHAWYMKHHSRPHKRSWQKDETTYKNHLKVWEKKRATAITKAMIQERHIAIAESHGTSAANNFLTLIRSMYEKAVDMDLLAKNPARGIPKFPENERERFLLTDEVPRFFDAVAKLKRQTTRDFFVVALFTGGRRNNCISMRWDDVLMERALWLIPASQFKNKKSQSVALSPEVMEILTRRFAERKPDCPWVFPGQGKRGHIHPPKAAWKRIMQESGLQDLRLHDLRRTLASWQANTGASLHVIGKSLGHKSSRATEIYARLQIEPIREAVNKATAAISDAANRKQTDDEKNSQNG